jgi:hypothetical protein
MALGICFQWILVAPHRAIVDSPRFCDAPRRFTTTRWRTWNGISRQFVKHPGNDRPNCCMTMLPETVRACASNLPWWIAVRESPAGNTTGMEKLQTGVLIDEKSARRVASDRGLRVTTLGVLGEAGNWFS